MPGTVIRGKDLAIDGESTTDYFEIHTTRELEALVAGNTAGGVMRECGNDRWWGFYELYAKATSQTARWINDSFTFLGAPVNTGTKGVSGTAKVQGIKLMWDIRNGRYLRTRVTFVCHGALSLGQTAPTDTSQPKPQCVKGLYPTFNGVSYETYNVDSMELEFYAKDMHWYVTSTTDGQVMHEDGDVDCRGEWRMLTDDSSDFPTIGTRGAALWRVTDSTYWTVNWMRVRGIEPWITDRRKPSQVAATVKLEFTGFDGTEAGDIITPAGATKWDGT